MEIDNKPLADFVRDDFSIRSKFVLFHPISMLIHAYRRLIEPSLLLFSGADTRHGNESAPTERNEGITHSMVRSKPPASSRNSSDTKLSIIQRKPAAPSARVIMVMPEDSFCTDSLSDRNPSYLKSIKLDTDLASLQAMSRKHSHYSGRRYFKGNRHATFDSINATASTSELPQLFPKRHKMSDKRSHSTGSTEKSPSATRGSYRH